MVHVPHAVGLGLYQGIAQNIVDAPLFACNAHRQILLVRTQGRNLVFLEGCAQHSGELVVRHVVQQQAFTVYHQVHLVTESDALRFQAGALHHPCFQFLQYRWFGSLRTVFRVQLGHHIRFARYKELLEDGFRWRERQYRLRIRCLYLPAQQFLQGADTLRTFRLEVQFCFRGRQFAATVQYIVLHTHVGRMLHHLSVGLLHQPVNPSAVLVHVDILVPFDTHHQFVLLNFRHALLLQVEEEKHAEWESGQCHTHAQFLVREYPVHPFVVEVLQPVVLLAVVETLRQPSLAPDVHAVEQQVQYRKQHDARDVRYQQSRSYGESLVHEDGSRYTAHENQRNEHRNGGERRAEHRCDYLRCTCHASPLQRVTLLAVLRDVLRYDDGVVYHHPHRQNQARQGNDIERYLEKIE